MLDVLPAMLASAFMSVLHGLFIVVGFVLIKDAKGWGRVIGVVVGLSLASLLLTAASFLLQGSDRAAQILVPGGELFNIVFLPAILNTVISSAIIICTAYALLVEPGKQNHV